MVGESCDIFAIQTLIVQTFAVSCVKIRALIYLSSTYLSRPGDSDRTFLVFESSCHFLKHCQYRF